MSSSFAALFQGWIPESIKKKMRRQIKRFKRLIYFKGDKLSIGEFKEILENNLQLKAGDSIIVHSSFGKLNAGFSPEDAVKTLKQIIGYEGNIIMPFYPGLSSDWLKTNMVFDVTNTVSTMGILTNTFANSDGVRISMHPTKAVAAWGKYRDFLINDHHKSVTPYDEQSPYYKLLKINNSKTLGLGLERNAILHACEDSIEPYIEKLYLGEKYIGQCKGYDNEKISVKTLAHCPQISQRIISPCDFLKTTNCPSYSVIKHKSSVFYIVDNKQVYEHMIALANKQVYRFDFTKQ